MEQQQQYTFVRENGRAYHADQETIEVLRAVQRWDPSAAQEVFDRGRAMGRIGEGSALALEQRREQGHEFGQSS